MGALSAHLLAKKAQRSDIVRAETKAASFETGEPTIAELQQAMASGALTARSIAEKYLSRIRDIDKQGPAINSIIEINPDALAHS